MVVNCTKIKNMKMISLITVLIVWGCAGEMVEMPEPVEQPCELIGPHCQVLYKYGGCDEETFYVDSTIVRLQIVDECELERKQRQLDDMLQQKITNWHLYHNDDTLKLQLMMKYHSRIFPCPDEA